MTILKRGCRCIMACAMAIAMLSATKISVAAAEAETANTYTEVTETQTGITGEELIEQINQTYSAALALSGRRSFYNHCSTMVNCTTVALGLQNERYSCNGNGEYDLYENIDQTDCGYDVTRYSASDYTLKEALNAISEDGTKDVTNIIIGWQSGSTYASSRYGHTCFIHGIVDGKVYFYESYGLSIGGTYYKEGAPIVCTIDEFADYYNSWARFEGAVHFSYPEDGAPRLSGVQVFNADEEGFTLSFYARDDAMTDIYAKVWPYGTNEETDSKIFPIYVDNGVAAVRINTSDFDGFVGRYYVACYATDRSGNVSVTNLSWDDSVSLYIADNAEGTCRALEGAQAHNAPYTSVNGADTMEYTLEAETEVQITGSYVNDDGVIWYQLDDGCWVSSEYVELDPERQEKFKVWEYITGMFSSSKETT